MRDKYSEMDNANFGKNEKKKQISILLQYFCATLSFNAVVLRSLIFPKYSIFSEYTGDFYKLSK